METVISTPPTGSKRAESTLWRRCFAGLKCIRRSEERVPDALMLLPTYEATDRELQQLAEPVFRERIDQVRTEVFTRYVTGG
jgi:hypothetical protein